MLNESNVASGVSGDILRQSGYRFTLQRYLIVSLLLHPLEARPMRRFRAHRVY